MSTTASPPPSSLSSSSSSPDLSPPPPPTAEPGQDIELTRLPAIVTWKHERHESTPAPHQPGSMTLDVHHIVQMNKAFFKLSTPPVAFKVVRTGSHVPLHILLRPEQIRSLRLETQIRQQEQDWESPLYKSFLGSDTVALHFSLRDEATIVVPPVSPLTPRNKASGAVLDHLREVQKRRDLVVYANIPQRTLPSARLQFLCDLVSDHLVFSIAAHANLASYYNGRGGALLPSPAPAKRDTERASTATPTTKAKDLDAAPTIPTAEDAAVPVAADHPPSYDELALSSPPPTFLASTSQRTTTRKRQRQRASSSPSPPRRFMPGGAGREKDFFERAVSSAVESALAARLPTMQAQVTENVSSRFDAQLAKVSADVDCQLGHLRSELLAHVQDAVDDLREELRQETEEKMEDEYTSIKDMLDDHVRDEVGQARDTILDRLTRTRFTLHVDDDDAS